MLDIAQTEQRPNFPNTNIDKETKTERPTSQQIWDKFHEGTEHLEECEPYVRAFASRSDFGKVLFAELKCGSWECKVCGPKLKFKWYQKHASHVEDVPHLEKIRITKDKWQAFYKRIQRAEAKYIAYKQSDDEILVLHTGRLGGLEISKDKRQAEIIKAISDTPFMRQPISQGRGWAKSRIVKKDKPKESSNWKPLDTSRLKTIEEIKDKIAEFGYESRYYNIEKEISVSARGLLVILKADDYWKVLWSLGVCARSQGESRRRSFSTGINHDPSTWEPDRSASAA